MVTNWSKVPPFSDHSIPWEDWLSWKKAVQSIMPSRSLTGLWWRPTFQQNICVLGDLRDPLSFCDLPILFLTALSFISSMQVLYCVALSLEAIHCVDIDLFFFFSYLFVRHHRPNCIFGTFCTAEVTWKCVFLLLYFDWDDMFGALKVVFLCLLVFQKGKTL